MKNKHLIKILSIMLILVFVLAGCKSGEADTSANANDEAAETMPHMAYEDDVFTRSNVDGKFAVYYLTSGLGISTWRGQVAGGDSIIMIFPDGKTALLDCGHQGEAAHVVKRLQQLGIKKLDFFIVSHPHTDHLAGYRLIFRYFEIGHVYMPPMELMERADLCVKNFVTDVKEANIPYTNLQSGDEFDLTKDVHVKVYNPTPEFAADTKINVNESSLLMKFVYKNSSFLMNGDIANNTVNNNGYPTEEELVKKWGTELHADVSKVGHHGNSNAYSTDEYREAVGAKIYTTLTTFPRSVQEHKKYTDTGAISLNTALDGDFVIYTSGDGSYDVRVSQDRINEEYEVLKTEAGYMHVK